MLLTLIIVLMLIGSAVVGSIYSNFLVFYSNFSETENYNKAYYASVSATERAHLVLRQRQPGYEGSGGWKGDDIFGPGSDKKTDNFSYLSQDSDKESSLFWKIDSTITGSMPAEGKGDVDRMLSTGDSQNYNTINYENSEIILLYGDQSSGNAYSGITCPSVTNCYKANIQKITARIRLPGYISGDFGKLNIYQNLSPGGENDDPIVDRQLRGIFNNQPFTIYATQNGLDKDKSIIKESNINNIDNIEFSDTRNPLNHIHSANPTIISPYLTESTPGEAYKTIFHTSNYKNVQLKFSLLNLLQSVNSGMIYPFLEYRIEFQGAVKKPDKYYKIESIGSFGDYQINNIIFKPTITESILRSFTTIL